MKPNFVKFALGAMCVVSLVIIVPSCSNDGASTETVTGEELEAGFQNPPSEAKPRVWWHWMNGNITKDGIQKDLEWMDRVGIGGFQNFDASLSTPSIVNPRLVYMTPEWKDAFKFATELADQKGLEMAIAGSPGWSESGGPWVTPEQAMKKIVWSEIDVQGGAEAKINLPHPPQETGTFQNVEKSFREGQEKPSYYKDIAVVAIKLPDEYSTLQDLGVKVSSSGGSASLDALTDGDLVKSFEIPYGKPGSESWILFQFPESQEVCGIDLAAADGVNRFLRERGDVLPRLESSEDGVTYSKITDIQRSGVALSSVSFSPVKGKFFRVVFVAPEIPNMQGLSMWFNTSQPKSVKISECKLYTIPRVNHFVEKAGFTVSSDKNEYPTPEYSSVTSADNVVDLTSQMASDGSLTWNVPDGKWKILRFGCSLTGHENSPASPEATGLEVDKLSIEHVRDYFTKYLDMYKDATGGLMGERGLQYIITDSWEAGCLNWTDKMFEDFQSMRGYDMHKWMPALAGYVVDSPENTDKFLFDFRQTIGELTATNHYDALTDILAERGMKRYTESHENGRAFVGDGMEVKRSAAVPMSAMWTGGGPGQSGADIRESASVSHIYGQKYVAAESLTAGGNSWGYVPETLKPTADWEMANGLNRFVIHTSVHQPVDDHLPGYALGPFGQWFNRHETWAENAAKPWMTYLARSSYMLQQGEYVADILYFYGEGSNITARYGNGLPDIPEGYNFDFTNADAILNALSVKDGKVVSKAGTEYSFIYMDPDFTKKVTLPVLQKLEEMVNAGAVLVGNKPEGSPSLEDDVNEYATLTDRLWPQDKGSAKLGKGRVLCGMNMEEAVAELNILPDASLSNKDIKFVHRRDGGKNWYWLLNRSDKACDIQATLHVSGYEPEIWNAEDGSISKPTYKMDGENTIVSIHFEPHDAFFVVFRNKTSEASYNAPQQQWSTVATVDGPWTVAFNGFGAPEQTEFETLSDWSQNNDNGIKYYSGTAVYSKKINVEQSWIDAGEVWLDLGGVKNIAEVSVNGKDLGVGWRAPFRFNISDAVKAGENTLEIKITNMWVNRLIGDLQPGAKKYTWTSRMMYTKDSPLVASGLIGPVTLQNLK